MRKSGPRVTDGNTAPWRVKHIDRRINDLQWERGSKLEEDWVDANEDKEGDHYWNAASIVVH